MLSFWELRRRQEQDRHCLSRVKRREPVEEEGARGAEELPLREVLLLERRRLSPSRDIR